MNMRWALRPRSFAILLVALAVAVVGLARSSGWASASSTAVYSQQVTQPIPPAQNYVSSAGGDGYDISLYNDRVYNVFHHQRDVIVDCHLQVNASACWSGAKTITDGSGNHFATSTQAGTYIDQATGKMWVYAIRSSDLTGGVLCVDLTAADSNPNPFCGFVALTSAGQTKVSTGNGAAFLSTPMKVGSKLYSFNYYPGSGVSGAKNAVLCFDLTTDAACTAQPHAPTLGAGTVSTSCPCGGEAAIGTKLIIPVSMITPARAELVCFDTTTLANCTGTWPMMSTSVAQPAVNTYGAAYPLLSVDGSTVNGFCLPNGTDPCYTLAGASTPTPSGMAAAITSGDTGTNGTPVILGPRVYLPNHNQNTVECWDYSTSARCSGFPLALTNLTGLYTVNADPQRPTCIWINSDTGTWQIQNFDAYTGGPCTQTRVLASQFVTPQAQCAPNSYQSIQIVTPLPSDYQGGSVSFADAGGNPIAGLSSVPLDATGTASLAGLNLNTPSGLPQFLITLRNAPVTPGPLKVRLDWTATTDPTCGGTNPTTTTLDANLSDGTNTAKTLTEWMGTPVDNNATLAGTNAATATGVVAYHWWTDNTCTTKATSDSVQTITTPGTLPPSANVNLPAGVYYETVDYSGDGLNLPASTSCGSEVLTVKSVPTSITYTGDTSVYAGYPATISFVLKDTVTGNTLANMPVTITLPDGSTYATTTDANGVASKNITAPLTSGPYPVSESFAGQDRYLASSGPGTLTVKPIPTSVTYQGDTSVYAGDPLTVSYLLVDTLTGNPLANKPVTISLPGGGTYATTTDSQGVATDTITAPSVTSNTTFSTSESFDGQGPYLPSSGPGSVLVKVVPTTITYVGDTSVVSGQPATLSYVLKDSDGNVLAGKSVTIMLPADLGGGTVSGTTNASGVFSTTATSPIVASATTEASSESFTGQGRYLASSGPGSLVVHPIPTSVTYVGDTSAYSGDPLTVSYLLTNSISGNPLANMPVTINLPGGGTYSTTTDAFGVASHTITAPAETSDTTLGSTESFAGQAQYLASSGPGSVLVKVIPTTITYSGDTSVYSGQPATLSYVLKDSGGNALAGQSVTIALPADFGGGTVAGTTDANGVFSTTAASPIVSSDTTYGPSEAFAGQGRYLASSGPGSLVVHPIPTSITYTGDTSVYAGDPLTVSYVLDDQWGNPLANKPVTINLPGGGTYSTTTDAFGVASHTITAPAETSDTTLGTSESFAGQAQYLASSGSGSVLIKVIPTAITYTGDTSVYAGHQATISFVLTDSLTGNVLANKPVTLTLPDGSTYSTTTDANGVASKTVTAPRGIDSYSVSEAFAGQPRYLASNGPGTLTTKPIPTSVTYTGDTSVYQGGTATLAAKLLDTVTGQPLANEPLTLTLSTGETCTGTTNASGVASCKVVVKEATTLGGTPYPISVSFGGDSPYLPSHGPGAISVIGTYSPLAAGLCGTKKCESLLADPTIYSNDWISVIAMDDSPIQTSGACGPSAVLDKGQQLYVSTNATSGWAQNYVNGYGGSTSTAYQTRIWFKMPSDLSAGQHTIRITACDGDGDYDQWTWTLGVDSGGGLTTLNAGPGAVDCSQKGTKCESLLADPTVASNTQLTLVAMDDSAILTTGTKAPSAVLSNGQILNVSTSSTSGQPANYVDKYGGSTSTKYQKLITINLPGGLAAGSYTIRVTAYDSDGDLDQWNWPISVSSTGAVTSGAGGGSTIPSFTSSITANFNGTSIPAGDSLWLSSILKVGGVPSSGATITFYNQTVKLGGTTIAAPEAEIDFSPVATTSTTAYDAGDNEWVTTVPVGVPGNVLSSGLAYALPTGLNGGLTGVTWAGTISSNVPGVTVSWAWAAAAYSTFGSDPTTLGVKVADDPKTTGSSDHAGTPESYKQYVIGGGTGGGGSNYTGGLTPTVSVKF